MSTAFDPLRSHLALWTPALILVSLLTGWGLQASSAEDVAAQGCEPDAIRLIADVNTKSLREDGTADLRIRVRGTQARVRVRLVNRTPGVVSLEGGTLQTAESSGGADNAVERKLYAHRAGGLDVAFELSEEPCPAV